MNNFNRSILFASLIFAANNSISAESTNAETSDTINHYNANFMLSPASMLFPGGYGVNASYRSSQQWQFEVEYAKAGIAINIPFVGIEIGEVNEQHLTLQARRYFGNSFNILFGAGQRDIKVKFSDSIYDLISGNHSFTSDHVATQYIRFGISNRFTFNENFIVGADWLTLNIPLMAEVKESSINYAASNEYKDEIELAQNTLKWIPSGAAVQISLGYAF